MKDILMILKEFGVEVPADKGKAIKEAVLEHYKTAEDYARQADELEKVKTSVSENETTITTLKKQLEGFNGVDVEKLKMTIADLEKKNTDIETEYQRKIADRDFSDLLKEVITAANGKNAKAITALLDVDTLKASKNQREDISAAVKKLTEAEDSAMLFGVREVGKVGSGNPIGAFGQFGNSEGDDSAMRAIMGLPTTKGDSK